MSSLLFPDDDTSSRQDTHTKKTRRKGRMGHSLRALLFVLLLFVRSSFCAMEKEERERVLEEIASRRLVVHFFFFVLLLLLLFKEKKKIFVSLSRAFTCNS